MTTRSPRPFEAAALVLGLAAVAACSEERPAGAPAARTEAPVSRAATPTPPAPATAAAQAPAAPAHGDHDPRHGGVVFMVGDAHYEVVLDKAGQHQVYVSDGQRKPVKATTFAGVTLTVKHPGGEPETLTLQPNADDTFWTASGRPTADGTTAEIKYVYFGQTLTAEVDPRGAGAHAGHTHDHGEGKGAGPHGGLLQPIAGGQLELLATRGGSFQIWMLDEKGVPRPTAGASARMKVALPGYEDVTLAPMGDHLHGTGKAIDADHAAAIVVLDAGGKSETARFSLHLEGAAAERGGPGHEHGGPEHGGHDHEGQPGHQH